MELIVELITAYGLLVVFLAVFLDQGGLPVPAYPPIIVAAALTHDAGDTIWPLLAVATIAAVAADLIWFVGGRRLGARLLRLMCRLSLSPDSCVGRTRSAYHRWGPASLIVAKFVPGFAAVATTLAGEMRTGVFRFLFFDVIGALLWAGVAIAIGVIFHEAVTQVLLQLEALGRVALPLLGLVLLVFVSIKWLQRHRFLRSIRMARVSVPELVELMQSDAPPLLLDVRDEVQRRTQGAIPGARVVQRVEEVDVDRETRIIVYCDCPNEASAALLAAALKRLGYADARPLGGGLGAWIAQGHPVVDATEPK